MSESTTKSGIAAAYDQWSESYDADHNQTRDLAGTALRKTQLAIDGRDVIEIGCGTGRNTIWLTERAASVLALDFSEGMLSRARQRLAGCANVQFIQHDVRTPWPIADGSADIAVAMLVLEHVEHIDGLFSEAERTLRPHGQLFICELHPIRQLMGGQAQFTNQTGEREKVTAFLHNVSDYVNSPIKAGFAVERMEEWRDADAPLSTGPRLLSLLLCKVK